ncbi:MAG: aminopeptidase [Candidatus Heimdallarchaeota archaeon]|nr:aminopeptidase [Candidatus Heimdallarchaeota archaeon]MBY8995583.1 aminopeptidase [Candidatus Heimdallarchaeota archaeon]
MYGDFSEKLAKLAVNYAVNVQKGDKVQINGAANAENLLREIYREVIKAGGHILRMNVSLPGFQEIYYKNATEEQIKYVDDIFYEFNKKITKVIFISSAYNTRSLTNIDPKLLAMEKEALKGLNELFMKRAAEGKVDWIICPYPNFSMAQEANMGSEEYKEFVYKSLALDKSDPVKHWKKVEKEQDEITKILDKGSEFQIIGEDTDLVLGIKGRKWINCCGHKNLPDGEVFVSPIEDAVNGTIRFTYPGIYMGREIENIWLKFKDGQVVDYKAEKGKDVLDKVLELENAKILGELAVGTNYGIQRFTKNMLFDEKMGGTVHLALGSGFPESGSKNVSPIHWDILKDMKSKDSKILLDGEEIYKVGKWLIPK